MPEITGSGLKVCIYSEEPRRQTKFGRCRIGKARRRKQGGCLEQRQTSREEQYMHEEKSEKRGLQDHRKLKKARAA
jgi:hypothetical protein